jgi:hypothetical protein
LKFSDIEELKTSLRPHPTSPCKGEEKDNLLLLAKGDEATRS